MNKTVYFILIAFLAAFLIYPLSYIFAQSFFVNGRFTAALFGQLFTNPLVRDSIANSFFLGAVVVALTTLVGVPAAWLLTRYDVPGKHLFRVLFFLPMIVSPFVGAIGMQQILARFGSLNLLLMKMGLMHTPVAWLGSGFWGIALLETLHLYPIMILNLSAALNNFDAACEEASYNLGAPPVRTFLKITFPLLFPGYFAAASIIFIWALTDLGTPLVFEYPAMIPVQVFNSLTDINANPAGYAMVVFVLILTLVLFLFTRRYLERTPYVTGKSQVGVPEKPLYGKARFFACAGLVSLLLVSILPHISVILTSFAERWFFSILPGEYSDRFYRIVLSHRLTKTGISNSLFYSGAATVLDLVLGFTVGFILARARIKGKGLLDALTMIPLAVPGIVIAFGYFTSFSGTPLDPRQAPVIPIILCYSIRKLPYIVRSTYAGFQQIHENLEEVSYTLGAGRLTTARRIILPMVGPSLFAGGMLVFAFSVLEVSSGLVLAVREKSFPIAKVIYVLAGRVTDGPYAACALGALGMLLVALCLVIASKILHRKIGDFFRLA